MTVWGGGGCAHAGILGLLTFFASTRSLFSVGDGGALEVRQNCHRIEIHYFQFIHKIKKKMLSDLIIQLYDRNRRLIMQIIKLYSSHLPRNGVRIFLRKKSYLEFPPTYRSPPPAPWQYQISPHTTQLIKQRMRRRCIFCYIIILLL